MIKLFFLVGVSIFLYVLNGFLWQGRKSKTKFKILYSAISSLILVFIGFFYIEFCDIGISNESGIMQSLLGNPESSAKTKEFRQYLNRNISIIDVSASKSVVKDVDDRYINITDRKKLTAFINKLSNVIDSIDVLVLDINFDVNDSANIDSELLRSLKTFNDKDKLVIGFHHNSIFKEDLQKSFGKIGHKPINGLLVDEELIDSAEESLPFLVYQKTNKDAKEYEFCNIGFQYGPSASGFFYNRLIPPMILTDSDIEGEPNIKEIKSIAYSDKYQPLNLLSLELAGDELSFIFFVERLRKDRLPGDKHIVILGEVEGESDIHQTVFGSKRGLTYLINSIIFLQLNYHLRFLSAMIVFYLSLFILFLGFTLWVSKAKKGKQIPMKKKQSKLLNWIFGLVRTFRDEALTIILLFVFRNFYLTYLVLPNVFIICALFFINLKCLEEHLSD